MIQKLGKYKVIEKLGEESLGTIYLAEDESQRVVIRALQCGLRWNAVEKSQFFVDFKAIASLQHPNITAIRDYGEEEETTYFASERLHGKNLRDLFSKKTAITEEDKLSIMMQVVSGFCHAHECGVLHGDIRPSKIVLEPDGLAKIRDFGIASLLRPYLLHPSIRYGAPVYLSPEQIQSKQSDERSDIFSLGIVFFEMLSGIHPFHDKDGNKALDNILYQSPPSVVEECPNTLPRLWSIIARCLEKDPQRRYKNMLELAADCKEAQEEMDEEINLMRIELGMAIPGLKKALDNPQVSAGISDLLRSIIPILNHEKSADYASLNQLMGTLCELDPEIRMAAKSPSKVRLVSNLGKPIAEGENRNADISAVEELIAKCDRIEELLGLEQSVDLPDATAEVQQDPAVTELPGSEKSPDQPDAAAVIQDAPSATNQRVEDPNDTVILRPAPEPSRTVEQITEPPQAVLKASAPKEMPGTPAQAPKPLTQPSEMNRAPQNSGLPPKVDWVPMPPKDLPPPTDIEPPAWFPPADEKSKEDETNRFVPVSNQGDDRAIQVPIVRSLLRYAAWTCLGILVLSLLIFAFYKIRSSTFFSSLNSAGTQELAGKQAPQSFNPAVNTEAEPKSVTQEKFEQALTEAKSATEQENNDVKNLISSANFQIRSGNLPKAKARIDKLAQLYPGSPEIAQLRLQWEAKKQELDNEQTQKEAELLDAAKKQKEEQFGRQIERLYGQGNYPEALTTIGRWTTELQGSSQAQAWQARIHDIQRYLQDYESAFKEKRYIEASNTLQKIEQANPTEPNLPKFRQQLEARMSTAKAALTVYRLGQQATVYLDGQPLGANGEIEEESVSIGFHQIMVKNKDGLSTARNQEFSEGQKIILVYDSAKQILRFMNETDREALGRRRELEKTYRFAVEHTHGVFRGACKGELLINGADFTYKPETGSHGFSMPINKVSLWVKGKSITLSGDKREIQVFKTQDEATAKNIKQTCDRLAVIGADQSKSK